MRDDCLPLWVEYEDEEGKYPLYPLLLYAFAAAISLSTSIFVPVSSLLLPLTDSFVDSFRFVYFAIVGDITLDTKLQEELRLVRKCVVTTVNTSLKQMHCMLLDRLDQIPS